MTKKKKIRLFVFLGILATCITVLSVFSFTRGIISFTKEEMYFEQYREEATEYIKSSPVFIEKYGNDFSVKHNNSTVYSIKEDNGKPWIADALTWVFFPKIPKTLEEFNEMYSEIAFEFWIDDDHYMIVFEKNDNGDFEVTDIYSID